MSDTRKTLDEMSHAEQNRYWMDIVKGYVDKGYHLTEEKLSEDQRTVTIILEKRDA